MEQLILLQDHKQYQRMLFGLKTSLVFLTFFLCLSLGILKVWTPLSTTSIYDSLVTQQEDITNNEVTPDKLHTHTEYGILLQEGDDILQKLPEIVANMNAKEEIQFHGAWDDLWNAKRKKATDKVCESYSEYCEKLIFDGDRSEEAKYQYTAITAYFLSMMNQHLAYPETTIRTALKQITLRAKVDTSGKKGSCFSERRWCANHEEVMFNIELIKWPLEYAHTLVHEVWHIVDLGVLEWKARKYDTTFKEFWQDAFKIDDPSIGYYDLSRMWESVRKKSAKMQDFCSMYGMTNMFEDFAECTLMYKNHNLYFKMLAKENRVMLKKYQYFSNLYDTAYLFANPEKAVEAKSDPEKRVWDLTKLQ